MTAHSPDYGFVSSPPGVREAANSLVSALQNCPAPPPPDPAVLQIIWDWIQVSYFRVSGFCLTFLVALTVKLYSLGLNYSRCYFVLEFSGNMVTDRYRFISLLDIAFNVFKFLCAFP